MIVPAGSCPASRIPSSFREVGLLCPPSPLLFCSEQIAKPSAANKGHPATCYPSLLTLHVVAAPHAKTVAEVGHLPRSAACMHTHSKSTEICVLLMQQARSETKVQSDSARTSNPIRSRRDWRAGGSGFFQLRVRGTDSSTSPPSFRHLDPKKHPKACTPP